MTSDAAQPRVYVVEDDDQLRLWVSRELRAHGYAVDSFASGNDFRRMLPMLRPGSVVTDLRMPGGDGMDLLSLLRPHWEKFPVIVMTAYADVPIAVQAMKLGAIDFIEKPF